MGFSLRYAFGRAGRHIRKIAGEARARVGERFRSLGPSCLRDFLFAQYWAIDVSLFMVFYNDDPTDVRYALHNKYARILTTRTERDLRYLGFSYAASLLAAQPMTSHTEEGLCAKVDVLETIAFIYDAASRTQAWFPVVRHPDSWMIANTLSDEIARVLQLACGQDPVFVNDWVSLVPGIEVSANQLLSEPDWSQSVASMLESTDFGGACR